MTETRKIAAILAADVVGFSRMASADEDRTLARLRTLRSELIDPTVASQNGRVFKRTGDGALVEFRSVVEAVRCAITVQNAMIERNVGMPADQRIDFRIGIHLGDVVEESDGDLMGDGVNIAARLEGIAEPGAICLSEDAYRQVKTRLDIAIIDLGETKLARSLDAVVEDCVNAVGVDANTASAPLLARVSGIGAGLAQSIVQHRDANGPFKSRKALKQVPRLGPKAFEQCAGFLRINGGADPLDASGVHPEAYPVVRRILAATKSDIKALIGNAEIVRQLKPQAFVDDTFGLPTVTDILRELEKPGRDPRPAFKAAVFREGVETLKDLKRGMILEGAVTNVAAFGAFVDIGVHQDGLVHISAMSKTFIKDPREVVKSGDIVKVKVLEVEVARKRIALTLRLDDELGGGKASQAQGKPRDFSRASMTSSAPRKPQEPSGGGALAEALRRASEKNGRKGA